MSSNYSWGTIEDVLPIEYVQAQTNKVLQEIEENELPEITLDQQQPVCAQIKKHIQQNLSQAGLSNRKLKEAVDRIMEEIKTKLSNEYEVKKTEERAPLLWKLGCGIIQKYS